MSFSSLALRRRVSPKKTRAAFLLPTEHQEQAAFFDYIRCKQNQNPAYSMIFAIPNGAHLGRGFLSFRRLAKEGFSKGVPDVFVAIPRVGVLFKESSRMCYYGLFLEFKRKPNKPSPEQLAWMKRLSEHGYHCVVVYSASEAIAVLEQYLAV